MALSKPEKDLFLCPICSGTLKSPKILACLHTFCEECIHEYIVSLGVNKQEQIFEFPCPICKVVIKPESLEADLSEWASTLRTNITLTTMLAEVYGDKQQNCDVCSDHQQIAKAQFWCSECIQTLCEECKTKHSWLTFLKTHKVCPLEEFRSRKNGLDLGVISEKCRKHPKEFVHSFCFDHNCFCCTGCITLDHRVCVKVVPIEDFSESDNIQDKLKNFNMAKEEVVKFLKNKQAQIESFETSRSATRIEKDAAKIIKSLKFKLDELFETFTKQLHVLRDDHLSDLDNHVRMLNQVIQGLEHWIYTAKIVQDCGSNAQFLIYLDKIDKQLKMRVNELVDKRKKDKTFNLEFQEDNILIQVEKMDQLGTISVVKNSSAHQLKQMNKLCKNLGLTFIPTFTTLKVEKVNTIVHSGSQLQCGVCIDDKHLLLGASIGDGRIKLCLVDKQGIHIFSIEFNGIVQRLCYVSKDKHVYISCKNGKLFRAVIDGETIQTPVQIKNNDANVGDLQSYNDHIYIVTDGAIKKFPITKDKPFGMIECFKTNIDSSGLNGLYVDDDHITFTTKHNEIKRTTFYGQPIFCYKNASLQSTRSLTVLSSGLIIVIDRSMLHVLSADGKQQRILLDKFENIKHPLDIWLDTDGETLYIAGYYKYVEVYQMISN